MFSIKLEKGTYLADELATFHLKNTATEGSTFSKMDLSHSLQLSPCVLTPSNPTVAPVGLRNELNIYTHGGNCSKDLKNRKG